MKITDIRTMKLWGPLHHGQGGQRDMIAKIIVRVDTDAGIHGLGEIDDFAGIERGIAYLREYLKGRDPMQIVPLVSEVIYGSLPPHHRLAKFGVMPGNIRAIPSMSFTATSFGPIIWAVSGVEIALCDIVGKALKTPIYNLLGGAFRDRVRVYLDRSSPEHINKLDAWRKMGHDAVKSGFKQIKFDIDYVAADHAPDVWNRSLTLKQINRIVERLGAVRKAVGKDFEICVDCHMHYNLPDALRVAKAIEHLKILWFEDPCPILNVNSYAHFRAQSPIPLCVGEMFVAEQFRLFIDNGACDILHPDVLFCGGLHEARKIADLAELNHIPMAMHGNGGALAAIAAAHVAVASRNFLGLEYHFIETPWIGQFVKRDVPLFRNGHLELTGAPGLGVELNREICRKYLAKGEKML